MRHQKRIAASKRLPLPRKGAHYITSPSPGPHKRAESIPLSILLRDLLKLVDSSREVKILLNQGKILINGVARKDHRFPVGFLDVISFVDTSAKYFVTYNTLGKLEVKKLEKETPRALKIVGKTTLEKGKTQMNFFTGHNIILDKSKEYRVGDSVILDNNKIKKHLKFEKGANVFLTSGKHVGHSGIIQEIKKNKSWSQQKIIIVKTKSETFETPQEYAYVVDGEL